MQNISIEMNAAAVERLRTAGMDFGNQRGRLSFHADSVFEPPFFSNAKVHPKTPVEIGAFTLLNGGNIANTTFGRYCSVADAVAIGYAEHPLDRLTSSTLSFSGNFKGWSTFVQKCGREVRIVPKPFEDRRRVEIGHDVWIGQGVFIRAGVKIGHGAVVAAHACVVSDVPPYAIVAGVPAKLVRYRFPPDIIVRLLASEWWRYALPEIADLPFESVAASLDVLEKTISAYEPFTPKRLSSSDLQSIATAA